MGFGLNYSLKKKQINEKGCGCLLKSRSHHCETFNYFNKNVPKPSIYNLPRVHAKKIKEFVESDRFSLDQINEDEVTTSQLSVLKSAHNNKPEIQFEKLREFFSKVKFPVHFLDYETYSSAVPIIKGMKPYAHLPIQYSLHILRDGETSSELTHYEYLAEKAEEPLNLINSLENVLGTVGSVLSWHKSFENTRNKEMSASYPEKSEFLESITERMLDLEDIFKIGVYQGNIKIYKITS